MGETISGGCACGAIRYQTDADPIVMLNCHCRDCQRASGSAYAGIMVVPKAALRLTGEPHYHTRTADSGTAIERGFCPSCGSPLTVRLEKIPSILGLQAGSLDDPSRYKPSMDVFTASAQPWDHMDAGLQKFARGMSS